MPSFIDRSGATQQVELNVAMYREAAQAQMSLPQWLAANYPTDVAKYGSVFQQMMASEGIFVRGDREAGIRPTTMKEIVDGPQAGTVVKDAIPASRILFPAVAMQAIEDKLVANLAMTANAFDAMVGYEESIVGFRYEQPKLNYSKPEAARAQGTAQLAQPASMLTITASDVAYKIPTFGLGLEISDQALQATSLDFVALSLARQAAVERNQRANDYVLALFNGDTDNNDGSLSSKGLVYNTTVFDAAVPTGTINQKVWIKFLMKDGTKRTVTHLVTDVDTALKIEGRTGKPTIMTDDGTTHRFDTQFTVMNPTWAKNPNLFLTDNASWPANTIMGLDKSWAIRRVRSLTADYQAIEQYVMRRSTGMRFDFGEHVNRLYDEAFIGVVVV